MARWRSRGRAAGAVRGGLLLVLRIALRRAGRGDHVVERPDQPGVLRGPFHDGQRVRGGERLPARGADGRLRLDGGQVGAEEADGDDPCVEDRAGVGAVEEDGVSGLDAATAGRLVAAYGREVAVLREVRGEERGVAGRSAPDHLRPQGADVPGVVVPGGGVRSVGLMHGCHASRGELVRIRRANPGHRAVPSG